MPIETVIMPDFLKFLILKIFLEQHYVVMIRSEIIKKKSFSINAIIIKLLGPVPKSTSGPQNAVAQIIRPLPTGDSSFASKSIVSVSHACGLFY